MCACIAHELHCTFDLDLKRHWLWTRGFFGRFTLNAYQHSTFTYWILCILQPQLIMFSVSFSISLALLSISLSFFLRRYVHRSDKQFSIYAIFSQNNLFSKKCYNCSKSMSLHLFKYVMCRWESICFNLFSFRRSIKRWLKFNKRCRTTLNIWLHNRWVLHMLIIRISL